MRALLIFLWILSFALFCNVLRYFAFYNMGLSSSTLNLSLGLELIVDVIVGRAIWRNPLIPRFHWHSPHFK